MVIETIYNNNVAILKVRESATIQQVADLKKCIEYNMNNNLRNYIIDLSECEFVDSTFIGALVVSLKKLKSIGGKLKIIKPKNDFQSMFLIFNGSNLFDMCDTVSEALNRLSSKNISQPYSSDNEANIEVNMV